MGYSIYGLRPFRLHGTERVLENRSAHRMIQSRLGVVSGNLIINVTDADGEPMSVTATIKTPTTTVEAVVDGTYTLSLNPQMLGETALTFGVPDGYVTPEPVKLTLNPGLQEVNIVLQKSNTVAIVATTVTVIAAAGILAAIL